MSRQPRRGEPWHRLAMELRSVDVAGRRVIGCCVPYNETSYVVPDPRGERIRRSAFNESIEQRGGQIFLNLEHDEGQTIGKSTGFEDADEGLLGEFKVRTSALGDKTLDELREGYWPFMSIGFRPLQSERSPEGVPEVVRGYLGHVALLKAPAYAGAQVLAVRKPEFPAPEVVDVDELMARFGKRPGVNLSPVPNWR